jgi:thiol-disulfide isomerase/thioredoxin
LANSALYADYPQYLDIAIENHPDTTTRAWLMLSFLPSRINTEDSTKVRAYAARLVSEFPQTAFAALALPFLDMNAVEPTVGTSMPSFSFPALEPSAAHIRNADLKGKTYLISFWATWCPPCVNQIQFLSRAYAKYNNKGLEIVSVSLDEDPQKVRVFLKSKIAMPWLHAYAPAAFTNEFIKRLGIRSVPAEYLVDQEGRLLASSEQLIGSNLELTLSKVWTH